jgi:MYXO-CTERM domain-containing protein
MADTGSPPNDGPPAIPNSLASAHFPWKDEPKPKEGIWQIHFWADFKDWDEFTDAMWTDITISMLNAVPAPGVLALLGLAGLIGCRRRRET